MTSRPLPISRRRQFLQFLADIKRDPKNVTAADKLRWLALLVDERPRLNWNTIYNIGKALHCLGPDDPEECATQAALVRAFTLELRASRALAPARLPRPAMPLSVFRMLLDQVKPNSGYKTHTLTRGRYRLLLKLLWHSGLRQKEIVAARRCWVGQGDGGYILKCSGPHPRQNRLIPIRKAKEAALCAASELRWWLELSPTDPQAFLFPQIDSAGVAHWNRPSNIRTLQSHLRALLKQIGAQRYSLESVRRSFFKRCRDQLGVAPALYFSGLSTPENLARQLRAEPYWPKLRSLFERIMT